MLEFLRWVPRSLVDGTPVVVLLHGRGSHKGDLQGLRWALPDGLAVLTPQAPHPGVQWGYGPGWAWYRYLGEDRADPASLSRSLDSLDEFLGRLPDHLGVRPGPLILGGFSQGGTTSLAYAMTRPGSVKGVINLSGFLVAQDVLGVGPETLGNLPVFWGHGTQDPAVPHALAVAGRRRLQATDTVLHARDYAMGHWVSPDEMEDLDAWLGDLLPELADGPGRDLETDRGNRRSV